MSLPVPRSDFIGLDEGIVHLATGGQPPLLAAHREAFDAFAADKASGMAGYNRHWAVGAAVKAQLAALTGLPGEDHALLGSASDAITRVVGSLHWHAGDNVVVANLDYASGRFALQRLAALGVEPRMLGCDGWYIDPQRLLSACDARTRLLYVSQVTSLTGQCIDIAWLGAQLAHRGIVLLVDASHALGVIPVDARAADFTVSSGYKFLCATHMGILAWNRERWPSFEPLAIGWASAQPAPAGGAYRLHADARRAHAGNSNHLDVYLLQRSLDYLLGHGIDAIAAHARALASRVHDGLRARGLEVVTPAAPAERAANVVFATGRDVEIVDAAGRAGILLWSGGGRVRASTHLFNSTADVDRYLDWLDEAAVSG
jgi:selenocysteine lyase/cysteine desulfurase